MKLEGFELGCRKIPLLDQVGEKGSSHPNPLPRHWQVGFSEARYSLDKRDAGSFLSLSCQTSLPPVVSLRALDLLPGSPGSVVLERKSVVVHFPGKAFDPSHLFAYQLLDVGGGATDMGT
jgi:hypothetical protein